MCPRALSRVRLVCCSFLFGALLAVRPVMGSDNSAPLGGVVGVITRPSLSGEPGASVGAGGGLTLGGVFGSVYVGAELGAYYFGTTYSGSLTIALLGLDLGLEARPSTDWALRPYLGLGWAGFSLGAGAESPGRDAFEDYVYFKPSFAVFRLIGNGFVGLDVGAFIWLPSAMSFSSLVEFGVRL